MGEAGGQHAGLAGAGAGEDQHRPVERLDRGALLGVQLVEVALGALPNPERTRGDTARLRAPGGSSPGIWARDKGCPDIGGL